MGHEASTLIREHAARLRAASSDDRYEGLQTEIETYCRNHEAMADIIDRLHAENERLREALRKIRDEDYRGNPSTGSTIARRALAVRCGGSGEQREHA